MIGKEMSSHIRTTRECTVSQLHPRLSQAIREYFQMHQLGDPDTGTLLCCETITEKRNTSKLASFLEGDPDTIVHLAMLLTADWFIWAHNGDRSGTGIAGTKLKGLQIKAFVAKRTKNMQLEVAGMISGTKDYMKGNLEMGPEPAAQKFCEEIGQAVKRVNPPEKKNRLRWFGA
jgi:hypothetical protein